VNEITGDFEGEGGGEAMDEEEESLLEDCLEVIRQEKKASTSLLQRRLRLGYGRAARMIQARGALGVKRQIFVAAIGGFDTHERQLTDQAAALAQLPTRGVCELATAASFLDCAPLLEIAISNLAERLGSCNLPHEIRALFDMPERDSPQAPYCAPQATAPQATFARADSKGTGAVVAMASTAAAGREASAPRV
jgi:hypothetical protein